MLAETLRTEWKAAAQKVAPSDSSPSEERTPDETRQLVDLADIDVTAIEFTKVYAKKCNSLLSYV